MKNSVSLIGRVGKDPETRHFDNGGSITNFSLATNEVYKNKEGEKVEEVEWHNIVVKGKLSEIAEKYVRKGQLLALDGKIKTRSWESNGEKKYITEVVIDFKGSMRMLSKPDTSQESIPHVETEEVVDTDDLPF